MKDLWMTTLGDLEDFLTKEIAAGRNPKTPEDWSALLYRMSVERKANHRGVVDDKTTAGYIAGSLRDEGINARVLKRNPDGAK